MIYTITLNPTLDITYVVEEIFLGEPLNAVEVTKSPGGKGLNVSRALRAMGADSVAMGLLGGYIGEEVLELLQKEGLILQVVKIKNDTRTNVIIIGKRDKKEFVIRSEGPVVEDAEAEQIGRLLFRTVETPEVIVLSGSLPRGVRSDYYYSLIKESKSRGATVFLDSKGEAFKKGIEAGPYLIKPNLLELETLAERSFEGEQDIVEYCEGILNKGVQVVVVSLGKDGALMVTGTGAWIGKVPVVSGDTVGAGDSMVAGLAIGTIQGDLPETTFHTGLSCGVSAVLGEGPGLCEPKTYEEVFPKITIEKIK